MINPLTGGLEFKDEEEEIEEVKETKIPAQNKKDKIKKPLSHDNKLINISKYLVELIKSSCNKLFSKFLPENYTPLIQISNMSEAEFSTPCATQIFNMCNKKPGWSCSSIEEVANLIKDSVQDELGVVKEIKVVSIESQKKDKKKEQKEGTKKKEKQAPKNVFIDIYLNLEWLENEAMNVLKQGIQCKSEYINKHVAVDLSSPNIAKEMHVGHLRSTILGDSICRVLEFLGNKVERINHVGDWGTQFGMLIAYLESINPNYGEEPEKCGNIRDLEGFYKAAKTKFDAEPEFKKKSQLKTVDLQKGDKDARKAWEFICQVSRENFEKIYKKLDVRIEEFGESFYDQKCRELIPVLEKKGMVIEDEGAKIIRVPGIKTPMIIVKSDGGIGYDTTDLAALNYRINDLKCDWLIYVVASEQGDHFDRLFKAGLQCNIYEKGKVRLDHMGFGLVQGADGKKISTRKGGSVKLIDLLEESQERAAVEMEKRNEKNEGSSKMSAEYIKEASEKLGYSAIKYFDLKQMRMSGYKFDWDKMLDDKGNTAVYLFYSYVRICSVYRKMNLSEDDIKNLIKTTKLEITEKSEKNLLIHLLRFSDVIDDVLKDLALNLLCDYAYGIATRFSEFYEACKITGNNSRIILTELCKRFMKLSFDLLGLFPIEKI